MKKNKLISLSLVVSLCGVLLLSGCSIPKKDAKTDSEPIEISEEDVKEALKETSVEVKKEAEPENIKLKPGAYSMERKEEIEGDVQTFYDYLLFNEDGTGIFVASDDVKINWSEGSFNVVGGSTYTYVAKSDNTIEIKEANTDSEPLVFSYIGETLPEDVVDMMRLNLDGTEKITNFEAADEFDYIIRSDTIGFYDYSGNLSYEATGGELSDMRASYIELTDKKYPVLFIETPAAPHFAGYTHALQYLDGKVYDVFGLDDIREVWEKAGIVSATYTGGGYGETNYSYYGFDDDGNMIEIASKIVMEDEEYAKDYKLNFGEDFVDTYSLGDYSDKHDVTKEEFDKWLSDMTNSEEAKEVKWKPLDRTIPF